jgi:hypothetical protein
MIALNTRTCFLACPGFTSWAQPRLSKTTVCLGTHQRHWRPDQHQVSPQSKPITKGIPGYMQCWYRCWSEDCDGGGGRFGRERVGWYVDNERSALMIHLQVYVSTLVGRGAILSQQQKDRRIRQARYESGIWSAVEKKYDGGEVEMQGFDSMDGFAPLTRTLKRWSGFSISLPTPCLTPC